MKHTTALKFKRLLFLTLAILLIASLFLFAACNKNSGTDGDENGTADEETEEEEIDESQIIKNGRFDLYNDTTATSFPVTPRDWSYSADSYAGANAPIISGDYIRYGVISVKDEFYDEDPSKFKTSNMKNTLANPGTINKIDENDKILMLENLKPTAAKYKSSTITIPANSYAIISVYVKTSLFKADGNILGRSELAEGQGANIAVTGGVDKPIILTGIETSGYENNGWKKYEFIIESSSISSKSINLELGLGTGSPENTIGYTEGFAFFANAEMKFIPKNDFNTKNSAGDVNLKKFSYEGTNYGKYQQADNDSGFASTKTTRISYSFRNVVDSVNGEQVKNVNLLQRKDTFNNNNEFSITNFNKNTADAKFADDLKNYPFSDENITAIQKNSGKKTSAGIGHENFLTVKEGQYYRISFWVKTSDVDRSGLNIYLINTTSSVEGCLPAENYKSISNINTTIYKLSDEDKEKITNSDKWEDWREYSFYVSGEMFEYNAGYQNNLSLEIWLGSVNINYTIENGTAVAERNLTDYVSESDFPQSGSYALITNIEVEKLTRDLYTSAQSADNSVTGFTLSNKTGSSSLSNGSFNNVKSFDTGTASITKPLSPADFTGMYGKDASQGSDYVAGGIVNTNLWENYNSFVVTGITANNLALNALKTFDSETFNSLLMINNKKSTSYGYGSNYFSLSANTITRIDVMVKVFEDAKANIYLVDKDGNRFSNYVTNSNGEKVSPTSEKVYNPYYDEKYDETEGNAKYKPEAGYDKNSDENKLLRKGEKYVIASTIPIENPYYDKNYDKKTEKPEAWKRATEKYIVINNYYNQEAQFNNIKSTDSNALINNGFITYTFFIKTGCKPRELKLELWNGSKYLTEYSVGAVFFDNATRATEKADAYYEYIYTYDANTLTGKINNKAISNSMYFDLSGYEKAEETTTQDVDDDDTQEGEGDKKPFDWGQFTVILISSLMLIALGTVGVRKLLANRKETEQTVVEKPTYSRSKILKTKKTSTKVEDKKDEDKKVEE